MRGTPPEQVPPGEGGPFQRHLKQWDAFAMHTIDELVMDAPVASCVRVAADVEAWPRILPHYRWVRFSRRDGFGAGRVEMAARRDFGLLPYPVWWESEMSLDERRPAIIYRHVAGITTGMDVEWTFDAVTPERTRVRIVHAWEEGPDWPLPGLLRRWIARAIIGPIFIRHVAGRTLAGVSAEARRRIEEPTAIR